MMETILFSFILLLIAVWLLLGILYFYMRFVSPLDFVNMSRKEYGKSKGKGMRVHGKEAEAEFELVGRSRPFSLSIPQVPASSPSENPEQNINNFAPEISENTELQKEEDNEMEVSYEMEKEDENEVAREELSLPIESAPEDGEVSNQSILARDLGRMRNWRKNSEEVDDAEVKEFVGQLKGTDFMEKYKENIAKIQGEQSILLDKIRRAEEGEEQIEEQSSFDTSRKGSADNMKTATDDMGDRPLSYYL